MRNRTSFAPVPVSSADVSCLRRKREIPKALTSKVIEYFVQAFSEAPIPGRNGPPPGAMEGWLKAKPGAMEKDIIEMHDTRASEKTMRISGDLIRRLNELTDKSVEIPEVYTEATRNEIVEAFGGSF